MIKGLLRAIKGRLGTAWDFFRSPLNPIRKPRSGFRIFPLDPHRKPHIPGSGFPLDSHRKPHIPGSGSPLNPFRKPLISLLVLFLILAGIATTLFFSLRPAHAVGITKYARTAGGNWSADATWSTTSGGGADTVAPTAEDDIIFDANSGNVTVDATAVAKTIDQTGYTNVLTHNAFTLTVSGSVTLAAAKYTTSGAATLAMNATGTLTSAGNTLYNLTTSVGTITLGDASTISNLFTHTSGTLITDGGAGTLTHNWLMFNSNNTNTRTITLGNSTINVSATTSTGWQMSNTTNLTLNASTSTINFTGNGDTSMIVSYPSGSGSPKTFNIVNFTGSGTPGIRASGSTFGTLTRTGTAAKTDGFSINYAGFTVTGTLSLAGNSATNRLLVSTGAIGEARVLTVTGANLTGTTNVDFMDITFADNQVGDTDLTNGGVNSIGDAGGNTRTLGTGNLVMTTAVKQYWQNVAGGNWSTAANWTSRVPLPQDDVDLGNTALATPITYNSGVTVTADMPRLGKSISWTGATWTGTATTFALTSTANYIYGSLTLISGMTFTDSQDFHFQGRGSYTLTSAGKTFYNSAAFLLIEAVGGSLTLQDALQVGTGSINNFYIQNGTFNANNYDVTATGVSSSNSNTRSIIMGSGIWNMTGYGGWAFGTSTGLTLNAGTSTILLSNYTGTRYFQGGGLTYYNVSFLTGTCSTSGTNTYNNITIAPGSGVLTFSGAFTFANMTMSSAGTKTVKFTKSTTYTMTGSNFLNGTAGNLITIDSDDGATAFTMNKTSGVVLVDYVAKSRMQVGGGATWYSTANSTPYPDPNINGNTGWTASGSGNVKTISAAGGNWSAGTAWNEGSAPTSSDDVFALASSGSSTIDAASVARSVDMSLYPSGRTLTHNAAITLTIGDASGGALNFSGAWTYTKGSTTTSALSFVSTSNNGGAGWNITWGGKTPGNITFNGVGGEWTLQDGFTNTSEILTVTAGELNTNGQALSVYSTAFASSANAIMTLGTSQITVAFHWNDTNASAFVLNAGTSTIIDTGGAATFYAAGKTYYSVILNPSAEKALTGTNAITNLTVTGTAVKTTGLIVYGTQTISGTLSLQGNSTTNRLLVKTDVLGTARTITAAAVDIDNVDFQDITGAGAAAPFTGVSIGDCGGISQITSDTPVKQYWQNVAGGSWSTAANWTSRVPLPQDDVDLGNTALATPITYNSGVTVTADMPRLGKSISWTGATYTGTKPIWSRPASTSINIYGSVTLTSNMTLSNGSSNYIYFRGRAAGMPVGGWTLTSAGNTWAGIGSQEHIHMMGGTLILQDAFASNIFYVNHGTFNANNKNVTMYQLNSNNSNIRAITMGSGTWTLIQNWSTADTTNLTFDAGTSTIVMLGGSSAFSGGNLTYNNFTITPSATTLTFANAFTFANMTMSSAGTKTVKFTKTTTYTMTGSNFLNGTAGNLITVDSDDGATQWTLNKTSGLVIGDYLSINRSNATGGATFYLTPNSSGTGNTGWSSSPGTVKTISAAGGNWSATSAWNEGAVPVAGDNVYALPGSGSLAVNANSANLASFDLTNYVATLSGSSSITLAPSSGTVVCKFGGTNSWTGTLNLNPPAGTTINLTVNGKLSSTNNPITIAGTTTGQVVFQDAVNIGTGTLTLTSGTLNTNNVAVTAVALYSTNSNIRTLTLGNSTLTLTVAGNAFYAPTTTNLTFNANTSTINITGASAAVSAPGKTFNNVNFTGGGTMQIVNATFANLTVTSTATKTDGVYFTYNTSRTTTITGTLTLTGNSAINRLLVYSNTLGDPRTLNAAAVSLTNVDFMDITGAGAAAPFTGVSIGDAGGNTQITADTPVKQYWQNVAGGSWSTAANWTSRVPLPQDDVDLGNTAEATPITYNSGVNIDNGMPRLGKNIDWTGATWTGTAPTWRFYDASYTGSATMYGSMTLKAGMSTSGTRSISFAGRSNSTLTSNGVTHTESLYVYMPGYSLTLGDAFTNTGYGIQINNGTFNTAGYAYTALYLSDGGASTARAVNISNSTVTLSGSGTPWNVAQPSVTFTGTGSTISLTNTAATQAFAGGAFTYNNITITPSAFVLTFSGAFTFANMTMSSAGTKTVKFTKSTTYTMTGTSFLSGTIGNVVTIDSDDGATQWTLSKASGTVIADYVSMNRSNAVGGANFYLGANSTMTGSTGWVIDNTAPTNPTTFDGYSDSSKATPITTDTFYNYPTPYFEWDGATDGESAIAGYYLYFGTSCGAEGANPQITRGVLSDTGGGVHYQTGVNVSVPDLTTNGNTYCFRMRIADNAGNISAAYEPFTYKYDITLPNDPTYIAANPSGYSATNDFSFSWPAATDGASTPQSGIAGYQYRRGNGEGWSLTIAGTSIASIAAYQEGTNVFWVRTIDVAGNISSGIQTSYYYTTQAPTKPTSLAVSPEGESATNLFTFAWIAPVHDRTITDYGYSVNAYPTTGNINWTGSAATTLGPDAYATQQGTNTFYLVAKDEAGNYALDAANVATVNFSCTTSAPPAPSNATITDTSNRAASLFSLTLKWSAGSGQDPASFDHYSIERSTNGVSFSETTTTASTAYIDTNLSSSTLYYYRVKAIDNAGQPSVASSIVSDTPTGNYSAGPSYIGDPLPSVRASSATITWVTDRSTSSFVRYAKVEADLSSSDTSKSETKGQIDTETSHSVSVAGLSPSTTYYYKVLSYDENRDYEIDSAYSGVYSFATGELPYISKVAVSNIKLDTADVSWETSQAASTVVDYGTSIAYGSTSSPQAASYTTQHAVTLDNLTHSSGYHLKIRGADNDGNELASDDYVFETKKAPSIYAVTYYKDPSPANPQIIVEWKSNVNLSSSIEYRPKDGQPILEQSKSEMTQLHKASLTGLKDNTLYTFYTFGRDEFGNLAQSDTYTLFTDLDARPAQISDILIQSSNIGRGTVDRSQVVVLFKTDEPTTAYIEYGEGISGKEFPRKTQEAAEMTEYHVIALTSLNPDAPYHLRINAKDKGNNLTQSKTMIAIPGKPSLSALTIILNAFFKFFGWIKI